MIWWLAACWTQGVDSGPSISPTPCAENQPILDTLGVPSGFVRCAEGGVNRNGAWRGSIETYAEQIREPYEPSPDGCMSDAECGSNERCLQEELGSCVYAGQVCASVCASDADCSPGQRCVPPEAHDGWAQWPTCVEAGCSESADCESGECALWWEEQNRGLTLNCRVSAGCRENADCDGAPYGQSTCSVDGTCENRIACY